MPHGGSLFNVIAKIYGFYDHASPTTDQRTAQLSRAIKTVDKFRAKYLGRLKVRLAGWLCTGKWVMCGGGEGGGGGAEGEFPHSGCCWKFTCEKCNSPSASMVLCRWCSFIERLARYLYDMNLGTYGIWRDSLIPFL